MSSHEAYLCDVPQELVTVAERDCFEPQTGRAWRNIGGSGQEEPGGMLEELDRKSVKKHWRSPTAQSAPNYHQALGIT